MLSKFDNNTAKINKTSICKKILVFVLALLLVLSLFVNLFAEDKSDMTDANSKLAQLKTEREKLPYTKQELIYVSLDPQNTPNGRHLTPKVYVVNYFEAKEDCSVTDYGAYSDVSNLQPDKAWEVDNAGTTKVIKFKLKKGEFFYYQGQIENVALPWQITYSYELDGKKLSANEIAHKNGHFALNIVIEPNKDSDVSFADSYIMQVQLAFPLANFSNIKADDAQISIAANKTNIVFMHLPKQTSKYHIEATAKDISLPSSNFTALPLTFQMEPHDLIDKQMGQLKQLEFGIGQLNNASNKLVSGYQKVSEGIDKLNAGSQELASGGNRLSTGAVQFNVGLHQYQSGLQQYLAGVEQLNNGVQQAKQHLDKQNLSTYISVIKELQDYLGNIESTSLNKKSFETLVNELDTLIKVLNSLKQLLSQNKDLLDKLTQLNMPSFNIAALEPSLDTTIAIIDDTLSTLDNFSLPHQPQATAQSDAPINDAEQATNVSNESVTSPLKNHLDTLKAQLNKLKNALSNIKSQLAEVQSLANALQELKKQLQADGSSKNADKIITKLDETIKHLQMAKDLLNKLKEANAESNLPDPKEIAKLLSNIPKMLDGLKQLANGSAKLAENGAILSEKGEELLNGSDQLTSGILQYVGGTHELANGVNKLAQGTAVLDKGFQSFQSGFNKLNHAMSGMSQKAKSKLTATLKDLLGQNFKPHSFINEKNQLQTISQFVFIFPGTQLVNNKVSPKEISELSQAVPNNNGELKSSKSINPLKLFFEKLKALFFKWQND